MDTDSARGWYSLTFAALIFIAPAWSRPVLVPPQQLTVPQLVPPTVPGEFPTYFGTPSIDGDSLIVHGNRATDTSNGRRSDVFLFERGTDGTWQYSRALVEGQSGGVQLNGNIATVWTEAQLLIFERGPQGWALSETLDVASGQWPAFHHVVRIDDGSLYVTRYDDWNEDFDCPPYEQFRKVEGVWTPVATIGGMRCGPSPFDVNDGRAVIVRGREYPQPSEQPADIFAPAPGHWAPVGLLTAPPAAPDLLGNNLAFSAFLSGNSALVDPVWLYRDNGGNAWVAAGRLYEPETELGISSRACGLRGNTVVAFGGSADHVLRNQPNLTRRLLGLRAYRKLPNGFFDFYAKLDDDFDMYFCSLSEDGRRVAAVGGSGSNGIYYTTRLSVFEIPDAVSFNGTQQDTFETGNFARWTTTSGQFAIATNGVSRVLRQSSLAGDAQAYLTAIDWADQSIEADLRPRRFAEPDRWFGLVTRRVDAGNYYYVTFRAPDTISLRRMQDGAVTVLGSTTLRGGFVQGRNYRVRLESIGDQHTVFFEGFPRLRAKDSTHASGSPGVVSYRTSFDADNVVVSSGARVIARLDTWERGWSDEWRRLTTGHWFTDNQVGGDVDGDGDMDIYTLRQRDWSGDVKWFSKIALGNQVISARVRPYRYGETTPTQDAWMGIAAQVKDENNYYYVTLRDSNELSLRRMVNGQVQVLATVPQTVTLGAWHDLRLEIINTSIRVHVNGTLKIQMNDSSLSGGGRNGILMYKAAADWLSYVAYQP